MSNGMKILKLVFVIPFSIGHRNEPSGSRANGSTSAVVLFACLVSAIIVVVGTFSGLHRFNEASMKVIWGLIVTLVTIATLSIFLIFFHIRKFPSRMNSPRVRTDASSKLQIRFLWTFGLGLLIRTSLAIATNIECIITTNLPTESASLVSSSVMIIFLFSQIGLITYMRDSSFLHSSWIYYPLGIILLANASIWINFATVGIAEIFHKPVMNISVTDSNINNASFAFCFFHSNIYYFSSKIKPYLFQISLDFLLLATLFIMQTWPSSEEHFSSNMESESFNRDIGTTRTDHRKTGIVSVVLGIILHIPFLVLALLIRFVYLDNMSFIREVWQISVILQKTIMLVLILIAFSHVGERIKEIHLWRLDFSDTILLCCLLGKIAMHAFGIFSATYCNKNNLLLIKGLVSLTFYFYQTLYIMISKRSAQHVLKQSRVSTSAHVVLFTLNITHWATTTFILSDQGSYVLNEGEGCLFRNHTVWIMLQYIIIPFNVYYDFQSAMYFYSVLPRFNYDH